MTQKSEISELLQKVDNLQQQPPAVESPPAEKKEQLCPRCGFDQARPLVRPSEDDLREFLRCLFGERRFTRSYTLGMDVGVAVVWQFRVLTETQSAQMDALSTKLLQTLPKEQRFVPIMRAKMLSYLIKIDNQEFSFPDPYPTNFEELQTVWNAQFGARSELVGTIGFRLVSVFEQLVSQLAQYAFDENFWQSAGLV